MRVRTLLRRVAWRGASVGLLCALASWLLAQHGLARALEEWAQDASFSYRGNRSTSTKLVLVALDEEALDSLGKPVLLASPELAHVVRYLHKQQVAAIGLDIIVPQSVEKFPNLDLRADLLGAAVLEAGNVVLAEAALYKENRWLRPLSFWHLRGFQDAPAPKTDLGFVNWSQDEDHFVRREKLALGRGDEAEYSFPLALFALARKARVEVDDGIRIDGERIPLDDDNKLRINFIGPPETMRRVSFHEVLLAARANRAPPADFHNAIVIIGVTAQSQQDVHATPYANNTIRRLVTAEPALMSGSELHANIVATLADRAYIRPLKWLTSLPALLLFGGVLGIAFLKLSLERGAGLALIHHFGWKALVLAAFYLNHWRVEMVAMLLLGFFAYTATFIFRWRWLRRMLGVVKSEAIARVLEADSAHLDLKGEEREVTVLFADVRSFTEFSEGHSPRQVVQLLNGYFGAVVPLIEEEGGTINTYMGDGVMVLYGAPQRQPDHALRAVRSAVAMVRCVHELKDTWKELGTPGFRIGVGIHTGKVVVGTMGSPRRLEYTAIGDTVNAAARIEAQNKTLQTEILISSECYTALPPNERASLGCAATPTITYVNGRHEPLYLYTVSPPESNGQPSQRKEER
jgi:adenylate cyclase